LREGAPSKDQDQQHYRGESDFTFHSGSSSLGFDSGKQRFILLAIF